MDMFNIRNIQGWLSPASVVVKLRGGIGNQMFQYAMGCAVAFRNNARLKIEILSGFSSDPCREYKLKHFNIKADFASPYESYMCWLGSKRNSIDRFITKHRLFGGSPYISENNTTYNPIISSLRIKSRTYLDGYWQSEKYFEDFADIIREHFTLKEEFCETSRKLAIQIEGHNSICLHVRRGDYANDPKIHARHGTLDTSYYENAIKYFNSIVYNPHYFIFSDDLNWAQNNIIIRNPKLFVGYDSPTFDYEDLILMSLCKHFIIANSSFSWWGAWVSKNVEKIVIAPRKWFSSVDMNIEDLISPG